ncbi:hypothetical protein GCM10009416_14410 [Craurococcus roseus]|uniref:Uncharacterized protein n=1 Tax=Craurococcus roseus TaxID=77585 RepID=A0ABP3PW38_9PROT
MDTEPGGAPDDGDRMRFYSREKTWPDSWLVPDPSDPDISADDVLEALLADMPDYAEEALVAACWDKRSTQAVRRAVIAAPNEWRGWVARFFHLRFAEGRGPRRQHRAALVEAWTHDHAAVGAAAGGRAALRRMFADAESKVPVRLGDPVVLWRGYSVDDPLLRRGVSWTTDKRVAAWFAQLPRPVSPVVLRCVVPRTAILHWSDEHGEREAVCFETDGATVDGDPAEWARLAAETKT